MIKKSILRTAVGFILAGQFVAAVTAQTDFKVPGRLALRGIAEPKPVVEPGPNTPIPENLYPIGWSRDGKFAYLVEPPDEACGCYFAEIVVQDLRTDKVVWKERYSSENLAKPEDDDLARYWARNSKRFSVKLNQYGIHASDGFTLEYPSVNFKGDVLAPKLDVRIKTDGAFMVDGTVTLRLGSKKLGSKVIYSERYYAKDTNGFRSAEIAGMLLSPFEPRAVVIVAEEMRGYEGPPNPIRLRLVGASLTTGFRRK